MLQLIVFELAILIAVVGMLNKTPGNTNFAFAMTFVFILWGIIQGNESIMNFLLRRPYGY